MPEKVFLRGVLLHCFNMKKTAAESHRIFVEVYGEHAIAEPTHQKWFARFKTGDFGLGDEEQIQEELTESLRVTQAAISKRSKTAGYIQSKEIGFHMNSSRETLKDGFACPKCRWNATKRSHFYIGFLLVMKNG